jgi:predicted nucleic-acid-binding protein
MIALDTNVLVRVLTRDDPAQAAVATAILRREESFIAKTVLLETEWVLRYTYDLDRASVYSALLKLVGYRGVEIEARATVVRALSWYRQGLDFADALHLASSGSAERFATFDRPLFRASQDCEGAPIVEWLSAR